MFTAGASRKVVAPQKMRNTDVRVHKHCLQFTWNSSIQTILLPASCKRMDQSTIIHKRFIQTLFYNIPALWYSGLNQLSVESNSGWNTLGWTLLPSIFTVEADRVNVCALPSSGQEECFTGVDLGKTPISPGVTSNLFSLQSHDHSSALQKKTR